MKEGRWGCTTGRTFWLILISKLLRVRTWNLAYVHTSYIQVKVLFVVNSVFCSRCRLRRVKRCGGKRRRPTDTTPLYFATINIIILLYACSTATSILLYVYADEHTYLWHREHGAAGAQTVENVHRFRCTYVVSEGIY